MISIQHTGGRIRLSYNCQAGVDEQEGVIVASDITSEANDKRQMMSMLQEVEIANGDRVIENAETRQNMRTADAVRRMRAKLQTEEGKEINHQRKKIVEPVLGQVTLNLGFRRFRLRGVDKASGEWTSVCLVHNIKKIYANIMAKRG